MKGVILSLILAMMAGVVSAQTTSTPTTVNAAQTPTEQVVSIPKTDWLTPFTAIKIDGPMNVIFKKVPTVEESRIIYDTKGNITSKFKFEVDKNGVLVVKKRGYGLTIGKKWLKYNLKEILRI